MLPKSGFAVPCQEYWVDGSFVYYIYLNWEQQFNHQQEMIVEYGTPPTKSFQTLVSQADYNKLLVEGYLKISKPEEL